MYKYGVLCDLLRENRNVCRMAVFVQQRSAGFFVFDSM